MIPGLFVIFDSASLVSSAKSIGSGAMSVIWYIILGLVILILLGIVFVIWYFKNRWNLRVEFKLTRSDGRITNAEWGKGYYDAKKGVVFVRRPTMGRFSKGIAMRIFDIRRYIQGDTIITVLQVGPEDFRPVLNDSWTEHVVNYKDDKTGNVIEVKESILNIKVDSGLNKAWKSAWDSAAKNAYSIRSLLQQFQTPIAIGIVIICCFVGFAILWTKVH
jgi:hypothetical protein